MPSNSPGDEDVRLHVAQEALRDQLAEAPLRPGAGGARRARHGVGPEPLDRRRAAPATPFAGRRLGLDDRRPPVVPAPNACSDSSASIDATVRSAPSRSALLTTKMSAISMMPALSAWTSSPAPGTIVDDRHVGRAHDVDFVLADADGLDQDDVLAGRVEQRAPTSLVASRQAAQMPARRHAADEHAVVTGVRLHAHAVAEDRAAGERARRIDGHDADRSARRREAARSADRRACSCRRRADR